MSKPVIVLKNSQPWFSLKSLLQTHKKIRVSNPRLRRVQNKNKVKWTSKEKANCPFIGKRDRREQSCGIYKSVFESKKCSNQFNSLKQPWVKKKKKKRIIKFSQLEYFGSKTESDQTDLLLECSQSQPISDLNNNKTHPIEIAKVQIS